MSDFDYGPKKADGQYTNYPSSVRLKEDGTPDFVQPIRNQYRHTGIRGPEYALRELTPEEHEGYDQYGYVRFEAYPQDSGVLGRYWTQAQLDTIGKGCGTSTTMRGNDLCFTYATNPGFYGRTFCVGCGDHLPIAEFEWEPDGVPMNKVEGEPGKDLRYGSYYFTK